MRVEILDDWRQSDAVDLVEPGQGPAIVTYLDTEWNKLEASDYLGVSIKYVEDRVKLGELAPVSVNPLKFTFRELKRFNDAFAKAQEEAMNDLIDQSCEMGFYDT